VRPGRFLVAAHLAVVALLFLLHPLSSVCGRDGALVLIGLYGLAVLWLHACTRAERLLLAIGLFAGLLLLETGLSVADARAGRRPPGLLDYGDLMGACGEGGCLKPGLDAAIVGERGAARFVTTRQGFRNREAPAEEKGPGVRRVLFLGDSFVAGYRTDQEETVGRRLELDLRTTTGDAGVEVLVAELPHPEAVRVYLREHAARLKPDLVLVGLTIGNDLAQGWAVRRAVPEPVIASLLLPADAFRRTPLDRLALGLDRSLRSWRSYRRLTSLLRRDPITTDYPDSPGRVHVFDSMHGLGYFYARRPLPLVEESWAETGRLLREIGGAGATLGVPVLVAVIPQRFQRSDADWRATAFEYGLDPGAFDLELPNRRIAAACARAGLDCVDLLTAFREEAAPTYLPLGDMHWNANGQAVAARVLASRVLARLRARRSPPKGGAAE
jgi:SGNH hydrolase-like domain, acetyltransferase AlgX